MMEPTYFLPRPLKMFSLQNKKKTDWGCIFSWLTKMPMCIYTNCLCFFFFWVVKLPLLSFFLFYYLFSKAWRDFYFWFFFITRRDFFWDMIFIFFNKFGWLLFFFFCVGYLQYFVLIRHHYLTKVYE